MEIEILAIALLAGWCGTPWPRPPWPGPWWPPKPEPPPPPCPVCGNVFSAIIGVAVVFAFSQIAPEQINFTSAGLTGFFGGRIGGSLYGMYESGKVNQ